jgi:hypothetical protein
MCGAIPTSPNMASWHGTWLSIGATSPFTLSKFLSQCILIINIYNLYNALI